ncbi:hypothetical protein LTR17_017390 [Elasticomyces elasticus]|nr:hypothetical protein LTR17_017390 [Elasticomyces elasticus]
MADLQEAYKVAAYLDLKVKSLEDVVSELSNGEDVEVVFKGHDEDLEKLEPRVLEKAAGASASKFSKCGYCGRPAAKSCDHCPNVKYCNEKCEAEDRRSRGGVRERSDRDTPLLSSHSVGGGAQKPKFVWLESDQPCSLRSITNDDSFLTRVSLVGGSGGEGRPDHSICVWFRDGMLMDDVSKPNKVLHNLTKGKIQKYWRGPLVLVGLEDEAAPICKTERDDEAGDDGTTGLRMFWLDLGIAKIGTVVRDATGGRPETDEVVDNSTKGKENATESRGSDGDEDEEEDEKYVDLYPGDLGPAVRALAAMAEQEYPGVVQMQMMWGEGVINDD